jgi:hypothetical protein
MIRKNLGPFPFTDDQQEQPFVQVAVIVPGGSSSSDWQQLARAGEQC